MDKEDVVKLTILVMALLAFVAGTFAYEWVKYSILAHFGIPTVNVIN